MSLRRVPSDANERCGDSANRPLLTAVRRVLSRPDTDAVWLLRAELLTSGVADDAAVWPVVDGFHEFLERLTTGTSSRQFSELASRLDVGAVSGVVLERMLEPATGEDLALRLLSGLLSEGLMVLATRQHVRAWDGELAAVYRGAAWFLYAEFWRWTAARKPELTSSERRRLLDALFAPLRRSETPGFDKAVLAGALFQILLVARLSEDLGHCPAG